MEDYPEHLRSAASPSRGPTPREDGRSPVVIRQWVNLQQRELETLEENLIHLNHPRMADSDSGVRLTPSFMCHFCKFRRIMQTPGALRHYCQWCPEEIYSDSSVDARFVCIYHARAHEFQYHPSLFPEWSEMFGVDRTWSSSSEWSEMSDVSDDSARRRSGSDARGDPQM